MESGEQGRGVLGDPCERRGEDGGGEVGEDCKGEQGGDEGGVFVGGGAGSAKHSMRSRGRPTSLSGFFFPIFWD